jgi:2-polyprenyl-3-methyl-5-hydroxy-6-metoxy-1,4-benzoquinol methylase
MDSKSANSTGYGREGWRVVECKSCGFAYLPEVPTFEAVEQEYAWEKTHSVEAVRRKKEYPIINFLEKITRWRLSLFPRVQPTDILNSSKLTGPVLDLGCGSGGFSESLDHKFSPYGIEISEHLANQAANRFKQRGGSVIQEAAVVGLSRFQDNFFAAAILRSYLEHDYAAREVMIELRKKVRDNAMIIIKVPNYGSLNRRVMQKKWCGFRFPDHVNYFTKRSLRQIATLSNFEIHFPWYLCLPTDDNIIAILRPK